MHMTLGGCRRKSSTWRWHPGGFLPAPESTARAPRQRRVVGKRNLLSNFTAAILLPVKILLQLRRIPVCTCKFYPLQMNGGAWRGGGSGARSCAGPGPDATSQRNLGHSPTAMWWWRMADGGVQICHVPGPNALAKVSSDHPFSHLQPKPGPMCVRVGRSKWNLHPMVKIEALIWVSFQGLSNFSPSVERLVQIQDVNPRIQKWDTKLILNLCMNNMIHISSTMWKIKNQPYNSTSCSDNALRLLVLVMGILYWGLQVMLSFLI